MKFLVVLLLLGLVAEEVRSQNNNFGNFNREQSNRGFSSSSHGGDTRQRSGSRGNSGVGLDTRGNSRFGSNSNRNFNQDIRNDRTDFSRTGNDGSSRDRNEVFGSQSRFNNDFDRNNRFSGSRVNDGNSRFTQGRTSGFNMNQGSGGRFTQGRTSGSSDMFGSATNYQGGTSSDNRFSASNPSWRTSGVQNTGFGSMPAWMWFPWGDSSFELFDDDRRKRTTGGASATQA